jgi:hypothetical protein
LIPYAVIEETIAGYSVLELMQMMINCVHEAAHSIYIKHVYNGTVADTFLGDELLGADCTIPIEGRVDNAVMRVQKLTTASKAAVGQTCRGGYSANKRGGQVVVGAATLTGAGQATACRIITATTTCLFSTMADPIMVLLVAILEQWH